MSQVLPFAIKQEAEGNHIKVIQRTHPLKASKRRRPVEKKP